MARLLQNPMAQKKARRPVRVVTAGGETQQAALRDRYERRARIAKALAHPTRLLLVDELRDGPRCVCELQAVVGADMSTVSKHLSLLRESGIIGDQRRGNMVFYALRASCLPNFLACLESLARQNAERHMAAVGPKARRISGTSQ